jgi:hypothetical protein
MTHHERSWNVCPNERRTNLGAGLVIQASVGEITMQLTSWLVTNTKEVMMLQKRSFGGFVS